MLRTTGAVADLEYNFLRLLSPAEPNVCTGAAFAGRSKLELLGAPLDVAGKTVIDFGCGEGHECEELARLGARRVIGVDIRPELLERAREYARYHGVDDTCRFAQRSQEKADMVISLDAFEHFEQPAEILSIMGALLKPEGSIRISFRPHLVPPARAVICFPCSRGPTCSFPKELSSAGGLISRMTAPPAFKRLPGD